MAKYYVISGELRCVIGGPHINCPRQAACEAILINRTHVLSPVIIVSEAGFDVNYHNTEDDVCLQTVDILKEAGLLND